MQLTQEAKIVSDFYFIRAIFAFVGFVSALTICLKTVVFRQIVLEPTGFHFFSDGLTIVRLKIVVFRRIFFVLLHGARQIQTIAPAWYTLLGLRTQLATVSTDPLLLLTQ